MGKKTVAATAILILVTSHAFGKDYGAEEIAKARADSSAVDTYLQASALGPYMCSLAFKLTGKTGDDNYKDCITQFSSALTKAHGRAQKTLKTSTQKAALKEHFVLVINQLKGIAPLNDELVIDYDRRQNAEQRAVDQQKTRFDVEK